MNVYIKRCSFPISWQWYSICSFIHIHNALCCTTFAAISTDVRSYYYFCCKLNEADNVFFYSNKKTWHSFYCSVPLVNDLYNVAVGTILIFTFFLCHPFTCVQSTNPFLLHGILSFRYDFSFLFHETNKKLCSSWAISLNTIRKYSIMVFSWVNVSFHSTEHHILLYFTHFSVQTINLWLLSSSHIKSSLYDSLHWSLMLTFELIEKP